MEHAEGWRKLLCNKYFATVITLVCGYILTQIGYSNIWPLFGSANQLLSALVLITLCVFLRVTGRENRTLLVPLVVMLCVTFTALVERCIALVKAYNAGTAVFLSLIHIFNHPECRDIAQAVGAERISHLTGMARCTAQERLSLIHI